MNTLKKTKLVPFVAMVFAVVAMSFHLVPSRQSQWYPVKSDGTIENDPFDNEPEDDCMILTPTGEVCAIQWDTSVDGPLPNNIGDSEALGAPLAHREVPK